MCLQLITLISLMFYVRRYSTYIKYVYGTHIATYIHNVFSLSSSSVSMLLWVTSGLEPLIGYKMIYHNYSCGRLQHTQTDNTPHTCIHASKIWRVFLLISMILKMAFAKGSSAPHQFMHSQCPLVLAPLKC